VNGADVGDRSLRVALKTVTVALFLVGCAQQQHHHRRHHSSIEAAHENAQKTINFLVTVE
jgi:hypothetical protein